MEKEITRQELEKKLFEVSMHILNEMQCVPIGKIDATLLKEVRENIRAL